MRNRVILASAAAVAAPLAAIAFGATAAHAATVPTGASAVTNLTDRLDSGYSGDNWATDTITRTATIALVATDSTTADCGPTVTTCYTYKATIKDTGTALAIAGSPSPDVAGTLITGTPSASIKGTDYIQFHSSSDAPDATLVPKMMSGNSESTTDWVEQFFPKSTAFGTGPDETTYTWTYADTKDCQTWIDASDVKQADSGNITGVDSCATTVADVKAQIVTVGTPFSLEVKGSTTSSDTTLTYSATDLPAGLSINHSTGKITGTPTKGAVAGTATITVKDFGGQSATTPIEFAVDQSAPIPVLSAGHATTTNNGATVTWASSVPAEYKLTLTGPGKEDGRTATVSVPKAVYGGLESGHDYEVNIQPMENGKNMGNPGVITFRTTTGKA